MCHNTGIKTNTDPAGRKMTNQVLFDIENAAIAAKALYLGRTVHLEQHGKQFQFGIWKLVSRYSVDEPPANWRAELKLAIVKAMGCICTAKKVSWHDVTRRAHIFSVGLVVCAIENARQWIDDETVNFEDFKNRYTAILCYLA